jgi:hypothetical protein
VPTSGDPHRIDRAAPSRQRLDDLFPKGDVREVPERPALDAQPTEIVLGFLLAQADAAEGRRTAREYLLRSEVWDDTGDALIYSSVQRTEVEEGRDRALRRIRATYQVVGRITTEGEYVPELRQVSKDYVLQGSQGQWRLSQVPRGLWIGANAVSQAFLRSVPYYVAQDGQRLVPDPVYLSRGSGQSVSALVQRVIDGPGPWLRDRAHTRFPRGTKLRGARLGSDGVLELDFSEEINEASVTDRQGLVAQLVWTLTSPQLQVESLRVLAAGDPFVVDADTEQGTVQRKERWSSYDPDAGETERVLYYNHNGKLAAFRPPRTVEPTRRTLPPTAQPAVDRPGTRVAVVRSGSAATPDQLLMGPLQQGRLSVRLQGQRVTTPSWGAGDDGVWVVRQHRGRPQVITVPAKGGQPRVVAELPRGELVHAFVVARDATRFAIVLQRDGGRRLFVGLIERADGRAASIGSLRPVAPGVDVSTVAWAGSGELVFIGAAPDADPAVWSALVDGSDLHELSDSQGILARGRSYQLLTHPDRNVVIVDNQILFDNPGNRWLQVPRPVPGS